MLDTLHFFTANLYYKNKKGWDPMNESIILVSISYQTHSCMFIHSLVAFPLFCYKNFKKAIPIAANVSFFPYSSNADSKRVLPNLFFW